MRFKKLLIFKNISRADSHSRDLAPGSATPHSYVEIGALVAIGISRAYLLRVVGADSYQFRIIYGPLARIRPA